MTHSETELRKQSRYNHVQEMYRKWCHDSDLDPYIADPSNVLNFLAWGHSTKRWRSSTVAAYRAQILALFDDKTSFDNNDTFSQFFKILRANEPDTSTEVDLDLSPIITYLRSFPSNDDMSPEQLTQKLCWLLGMCAFLRPSDIERIDLDHCRVDEQFISLHIVRPKETSAGVHKSKSIILRAHSLDRQLCPVQTFKDYVSRLASTKISVPHPTMSSLRYNPLIRHIKSPELHVGAQRISKHIAGIMSRVNVPPGHRLPKARAAGSTHAAKNGVSVDDIVAQGNWSSRRMFDSFYRLSSKTRSNFTDVVLG